ncbi:hypothetical protein U9M48_038109 [Paspalum notatum var. saurae]|uniref:Uncharacterized protein n=1 Tax=Paspalum notatum var. saurae TaxID=547442 RepID=A0AAQ3UGY6_PASNO
MPEWSRSTLGRGHGKRPCDSCRNLLLAGTRNTFLRRSKSLPSQHHDTSASSGKDARASMALPMGFSSVPIGKFIPNKYMHSGK